MSITDIYGYTPYDYWFLLRLVSEKFEFGDTMDNIRMKYKVYTAQDSLCIPMRLSNR